MLRLQNIPVLDANGIALGSDVKHVKRLAEFRSSSTSGSRSKLPHRRASRSGRTQGGFYKLLFKALKTLLDEGVHAKAAAMRRILIQMLDEIDPEARYSETLEERVIDAYDTSVKRFKVFSDKEYAERLKNEILGRRKIGTC